MKKLIFLTVVTFFIGNILNAQKVDEKVEIESGGSWYPGKILKVNDEEKLYFVSYDGWEEISNEWVGVDRLKYKKATGKFKVGDKVEVEYGMIPEAATITEVGENKYHIVFDKSVFGDKWVNESQMKKL
jgi:hypothetical protein